MFKNELEHVTNAPTVNETHSSNPVIDKIFRHVMNNTHYVANLLACTRDLK